MLESARARELAARRRKREQIGGAEGTKKDLPQETPGNTNTGTVKSFSNKIILLEILFVGKFFVGKADADKSTKERP